MNETNPSGVSQESEGALYERVEKAARAMGCDVMRNPAALTIKKDGIDVIFVNGKIASMTGEITRFSGPDGVYDQNKYNEALRAMLAGLGGPFEYRIDMLGQVHKGTIGADGGIS